MTDEEKEESKRRIQEAEERTTEDVLVLAVLGNCWAFHDKEDGHFGAMLWEL